jgi:hypothetical protein
VLQLVEKERELGGQGDALSRFLRLVYEFLADPAVSAAERAEYRRLRDRFARYGDDPQGEKVLEPQHAASPEDLQRRVRSLRRRIDLIVYPRLRDLPEDDPARDALRARLEELDDVAASYTERAAALHQTEHRLVMTTGEFLLPQEETGDDHAGARADGKDGTPDADSTGADDVADAAGA